MTNIIGKTISVHNQPMRVVGLQTGDSKPSLYVPIDVYYPLSKNISFFKFNFARPLSEDQFEELTKIFAEYPCSISSPTQPPQLLDAQALSSFLQILCTYLLGMITIFLLYQFLIKSREGELVVLSLCGASHQDILQLLIGDVAALSFVPTLLVNIFTMIPFLVHITRGSVMTAKQRLMK